MYDIILFTFNSPRTVQQGNGVIPPKQPQRPYENTGMVAIEVGHGHGSHSNTGTLTTTNNYMEINPQTASLALSNISCEYYLL